MVPFKERPMIAPVDRKKTPVWHAQFLAMLEAIQERARFSFRDRDPDAQEEAVQAVAAQALVDFLRLVEQDRAHIASASPLGRYAVAQVRVGRGIEGRLNSDELLSSYA